MNATSPDLAKSAFHRLIERNRGHATNHPGERPALEPTLRSLVLACADHRADPTHALCLAPNEAVVLRNPGGRVTESFINHLAVLATVGAIEGLDPGFELIIMHHTDCGVARLADDRYGGLIASMFGDVGTTMHTVTDPYATLVEDIESLRNNPFIPRTLVVGGLVYDVATGQARAVIEPATLAAGVQ